MSRRTLSKSLSFLSAGCFLLAALFNFPGAAVRAENLRQFITETPATPEKEPAAAVPAFSDFVGIYALIEKVVLGPNDSAPERIQVWGAFATASAVDRNTYESPRRGYFYYSLTPGKQEACRREWADFKTIAGSGQVIGFGSRGLNKGRLRKANEKAESPDPYPVDFGLTRMSQRSSTYAPVRELRSLPAPHSPAEGAEVKSGKVTLVAGNVADPAWKNAKYVFEIKAGEIKAGEIKAGEIKAGGSAEQETSPPITAGEKETKWSPNLTVKAGEKYTWRVKATDGQWTGPTASSVFAGVR